MAAAHRSTQSALLLTIALCCNAAEARSDCPRTEVVTHVLRQFGLYGPHSVKREYFGFIYESGGSIGSAVVRGGTCPDPRKCGVDARKAAAALPHGAKVLGEWHTHPRGGSALLSSEDVRGANANRHIRCYAAFYSKPNGEILEWNPRSDSVPAAMASRVSVGRFRRGDSS